MIEQELIKNYIKEKDLNPLDKNQLKYIEDAKNLDDQTKLNRGEQFIKHCIDKAQAELVKLMETKRAYQKLLAEYQVWQSRRCEEYKVWSLDRINNIMLKLDVAIENKLNEITEASKSDPVEVFEKMINEMGKNSFNVEIFISEVKKRI